MFFRRQPYIFTRRADKWRFPCYNASITQVSIRERACMEPIRRRSTLWRVLLFFILITAFFDLVIMATMPKYKSASTPADIAKTDLAQDYICLDSSAATVYPGALLTPARPRPLPCSPATCCCAGIRISPPAAPAVSWST